MGMGTMSVTAIIVDDDKVEEVCPEEYKAFQEASETYEDNQGSLFLDMSFDDCQDEDARMAAENLQDAFHVKTGLHLYFGYLDEDYSERYDDFTGAYFHIPRYDVYTKSPAALQFEEDFDTVLETQHSTTWG